MCRSWHLLLDFMKAKQIAITSGPAGGTLVTEVFSNSGKRLGFIRVVNCDWTPILGGTTIYIAQQCFSHPNIYNCRYDVKACETLAEAYKFLGVSSKELDVSDLGEYPFDEKIPSKYWKK